VGVIVGADASGDGAAHAVSVTKKISNRAVSRHSGFMRQVYLMAQHS
jgi:hypothetical protein